MNEKVLEYNAKRHFVLSMTSVFITKYLNNEMGREEMIQAVVKIVKEHFPDKAEAVKRRLEKVERNVKIGDLIGEIDDLIVGLEIH